MGLKVYWTDFSKCELKNIFDFHKEKVSLKIAKQIAKQIVEIAKQIVEKADTLGNFPKI